MAQVTEDGVVLDDADVDALGEAVRTIRRAARGDSNDAEIEAGHDLAELVAGLVGVPDGEDLDEPAGSSET